MPSQASLLAGLLISGAVFAQEFRASVAGQVTDSTGATVPGAEVVVTSLERNTSFRTVSNSAGRYVLEFLLPGHYTLTAEKSGFMVGDILIALEGQTVSSTDDIQRVLDPDQIGKAVTVRIIRGGSPQELSVTVGERSSRGE